MKSDVPDYVSFPLVGLAAGFLLVHFQALIGFADFQLVYVLWFGLFGFVLAVVQKSSLSEKYKSWLQGAMWFAVLCSGLLFLFWGTVFNEDTEYPVTEVVSQESTEFETDTFTEYELEYVSFRYPADMELRVDSAGAVKLLSAEKLPWGLEEQSEILYIVNELETDSRDFDAYAEEYARSVHESAKEFGLAIEPAVFEEGTDKYWVQPGSNSFPHYDIYTDELNGIPVVVEQSNFGGMCGNNYYVTYWLGEGRLVSFSTDCFDTYPNRSDLPVIERITNSFQII